MGTNFYADLPDGAEVHLGKRSMGWFFGFHAHPGLFENLSQLIGWLENTPCTLRDEYGQATDPVSFVAMAREWGKERESHGLPRAHRHKECWCGMQPRVHGSYWDIFDERTFIDTDSDTDWSYGPEDSW